MLGVRQFEGRSESADKYQLKQQVMITKALDLNNYYEEWQRKLEQSLENKDTFLTFSSSCLEVTVNAINSSFAGRTRIHERKKNRISEHFGLNIVRTDTRKVAPLRSMPFRMLLMMKGNWFQVRVHPSSKVHGRPNNYNLAPSSTKKLTFDQ